MSTRWWGWGDASRSYDLSRRPGFWPFLESKLGPLPLESVPPVPIESIRIRRHRVPEGLLDELAALLGSERVSTADEERIAHAYGKGYLDLLRLRRGEVPCPPDAVLFPSTADEIAGILALASRGGVSIIPFGGGTGVVGGVEVIDEGGPTLSLDLGRMNRVVAVDPEAQTVTAEAGVLGPALEFALNAAGLTLGHFPQSFEFSTLGGWIATRSAGHASTGYGKIEEMVVSLILVSPAGTIATREVPASAAGPGLKELLIGSEGTLGVITQATMRTRPLPAASDYRAFLFRSFEEGVAAVRELIQTGPLPATVRLSDEEETEASVAMRERRGEQASGLGGLLERAGLAYLRHRGYEAHKMCAGILGFEGGEGIVAQSWSSASALLRRRGGYPLGPGPARAWRRDYFELPYLRDLLLDHRIMVDTLETAATWDRLAGLRGAVAGALRGEIGGAEGSSEPGGLVACHVSHAYPAGASLYCTYAARQSGGKESEQWLAAKRAATAAIMAAGGTISHHHGVGSVHREWIGEEHGETGVRVLRAVRAALDPDGIMNPGKVLG